MAILGDTRATSLVVNNTTTLASLNANSTGLGTNGQVLKSNGTTILWATLSKSDVGLGNVANKTITVTSTSVSDGTNTFNKYTHPTGDGNLHVPATGTSNNGKVLKAGSTAGSISWASLAKSDISDFPTNLVTTDTAQTISGGKTFSSEVKMTAGGTSDISSGILAAFKTNMAQSTNFITHNIYTGGTNSTTPITFYKYTSVSSQAPGTKVQLAKIDTDGNFYEGTTKLSEKYAAISHTHTTSLTSGGTATVNLAANTAYTLTAGGTSVIFKTPADGNTDTKVNVVARGTTKTYLLGDTTAPTSSAAAHTAVAETGIYMTTTAGQINATTYKVNEAVTLQYTTATKSLDFIFA